MYIIGNNFILICHFQSSLRKYLATSCSLALFIRVFRIWKNLIYMYIAGSVILVKKKKLRNESAESETQIKREYCNFYQDVYKNNLRVLI